MRNIENILIIRRAAIGDIIFTLPAYYMLKTNFPNAKISFLTKDIYAPVLKGFPGLDQVLVFDTKALKSKKITEILKSSINLLHTIRLNNYQLAIDYNGQLEHALLLRLAGIKHRWSTIKPGKPLHTLLYTNTYIKQPFSMRNLNGIHRMHRIDQQLQLLQQGGLSILPFNNEYFVPMENLEKAKALFEKWGLSFQKPTLFIQPFTNLTTRGKIWPLDRYLALADYWKNKGIQVLFGGGPSDVSNLKNVAAHYPVAAGQCDFITSVGLTKLSSLVVGGDTGLLHAALAAGKRILMLLGPTNYEVIGPYKHPEWTIRPKQGISIEDISIDQVLESTEKVFIEIVQGFR